MFVARSDNPMVTQNGELFSKFIQNSSHVNGMRITDDRQFMCERERESIES